ncbi:MAG: hypothetical protein KF830_08615 [Planctomycetes bacterium]|nr:hypothetical protein [Planctomycetota bacterium]
MDFVTAIEHLDRYEVFACCGPFLGHPAEHRLLGDHLRESPLLERGKALDGFDVAEAGGQRWLVHADRVVLRPAPRYHDFEVAGQTITGRFSEHDLSDAVEDAYRRKGAQLVVSRDAVGWLAGFGSLPARGATLEEALRNLLQK